MNRRDFVRASSLSTLALLIPITNCSSDKTDLNGVLALPHSLSYIFDEETIRTIGSLYLIKMQITAKEINLKKLLLEKVDIKCNSDASTDYSDILNRLSQIIKQDFETNRTVEIDGWILSETEAQQCALYSTITN